jgi:hypothetical protein
MIAVAAAGGNPISVITIDNTRSARRAAPSAVGSATSSSGCSTARRRG